MVKKKKDKVIVKKPDKSDMVLGVSSVKKRVAKDKNILLSALEKNSGYIRTACKSVGISHDTYYRWRKEDEVFKYKADEVIEVEKERMAIMLTKKAEMGDTGAIIFYLKTKGRDLGFQEKQEVEHVVSSGIAEKLEKIFFTHEW